MVSICEHKLITCTVTKNEKSLKPQKIVKSN